MVNKSDKTKPKNWIEGDTFAWKIESEKYPEYNGRYLILIKLDIPEWDVYKSTVFFRVKITKDKSLPKEYNEINQLEYVKIGYRTKYTEHDAIGGIENVQEDEFEYIYIYIIQISYRARKYPVPSNLYYLGNYNFETPKNEYISVTGSRGEIFTFWYDAQEKIISSYERDNLQKGDHYTKEGHEIFIEQAKEEQRIDEFYLKYIKGHEKEFLLSLGIDVEKEEQEDDSLTYVGGDENFKEK